MIEIRYNTSTKEPTGCCGDETQFGNLDRERPREAIVIVDIPLPEKTIFAYLYDEATQNLIDNPDYVEPLPPRDLAAEIDELKAKVEKLEKEK